MSAAAELPPTYAATRRALHRVAAHVLGRRRYQVTGRFGLRVTPGGLGTPAFGKDVEVVRVSRDRLVHERDGRVRVRSLRDSSLTDLAAFVGADLDADFSVGRQTPPKSDATAALELDAGAAELLADWLTLGALVLDAALDALGPAAGASVPQLWPEHFDLGCDVVTGDGRANLGVSPGDDWSAEPYLYVGPWGEVPGGSFWNAPFGAVLLRGDLPADPLPGAVGFLLHGVTQLTV